MIQVMIIGTGGIAPAHIEAYLEFPDKARIAVLVNRNLDRARAIKEKYNLDCLLFDDYTAGLDFCDAVSICTPPSTHREIAVTCLNAKKHVLCEKPLAQSLADCDEILCAAKSNQAVFAAVAQSRYISSVRNVIKIIQDKVLGNNFFADVHSYWYRGQSYYDLAWRGLWHLEGGGCTLNHAVHHIDLLLWAKGLPCEVTAVFGNLNHANSEEEDLSLAILKYNDGSMASLTCSLLHHSEAQAFNFQCEKGGISLPFAVQCSTSRENGFPMDNQDGKEKIEALYYGFPPLKYEHHMGQIENFLDGIINGVEQIASGKDGKNAIELITAIYESAILKKTLTLPLQKDDPFYTFEKRVELSPKFNRKSKSVDFFDDTFVTSFKNTFT